MKAPLIFSCCVVLVGALSFFAGYQVGHSPTAPEIPSAGPIPETGEGEALVSPESSLETQTPAAEDSRQLVKIATLNGETANAEFQRNVRIMQLKKQRVEQLQRERLAAEGTEDAARIQIELETAAADLVENNRKMVEIYGFSLERDYVYVIEESTLMMQVLPDEDGVEP